MPKVHYSRAHPPGVERRARAHRLDGRYRRLSPIAVRPSEGLSTEPTPAVYVLSPQFNRDATPADVRLAVEQAKKIYRLYNAADNVMLDEPWDYNRLPLGTQERVIKWMTEKMK